MIRVDSARQLQLFRCGHVTFRTEACTAARFIETGRTNYQKLLVASQPLRVDGRRAAEHAYSGELDYLIGNCHQRWYGHKRVARECGIESGEHDALAGMDELHREANERIIEELRLIDADDINGLKDGEERVAQSLYVAHGPRIEGLCAVRSDGFGLVAEIHLRLEARDAQSGDLCALQAANQLFALAGEHGSGNDFEASRYSLRLCSDGHASYQWKRSVLRAYAEMSTTASSASTMPAVWLLVVRSFRSSEASRIVEAG